MCCAALNLFSHVQLFVTLGTVARQAPLSMGFSRQEYWSGCIPSSREIFPTQGSNSRLLKLMHCRLITTEPPGKPILIYLLPYKPKDTVLTSCPNCSSFVHWELVQVGSWVSLMWTDPFVFSTPWFSGATRCPASFSIFPTPASESDISQKSSGSFH